MDALAQCSVATRRRFLHHGITLAGTAVLPAGRLFTIGSNGQGQSAPGYLRAPVCDVAVATDLGAIGFPAMHMVMRVVGES